MPRPEKLDPKHRVAPPEPAVERGFRNAIAVSGVAVAVTGVVVGSGLIVEDRAPAGTGEDALASAGTARAGTSVMSGALKRREAEVSRSDRREAPSARNLTAKDAREIARAMLPDYGFDDSEFACLDALFVSESDWRVDADNPTSTAYGIPQALLSEHKVPADYMTNPVTQIKWGLWYIRDSYGTPCAAWEFKQANNWY